MIFFFDGESAPMPDGGIWIRSISENTQNEELISVRVEEGMDWNRVCRFLEDAQAIVLTADVYMDSVSPRVLGFLEKIEQAVIGGESIGAKFYAILYTDLYEGEQTSIANEEFCRKKTTGICQISDLVFCGNMPCLSGKKYKERMFILTLTRCQGDNIFVKIIVR